MNWQAFGIAATVFVAFCGYIATYINNTALEGRRARASLLNTQLENLYGPLLALNHASSEAWGQFWDRYGRKSKGWLFDDADPPTVAQVEAFRHWMRTVFMPINERMEEVITKNAHLIEGSRMPESFLELLAHVGTYRAVMAKWTAEDAKNTRGFVSRAANTAGLNFPKKLGSDVEQVFNDLKAEQQRLLRRI